MAQAHEMETVTVNAKALQHVLQALVGPPHLIAELRAIRGISELTGGDNPINVLIDEYNSAVSAHEAKEPA